MENGRTIKHNLPYISMAAKYGFSLAICIIACINHGDWRYLVFGILELAIIGLGVNLVAVKSRIVASVASAVFNVIYNFEFGSLLFAHTFLTLVMVTNIDSAEALKGNGPLYITGIVLIIVFGLFPVKYIKIPKIESRGAVAIALAAEVAMLMVFPSDGSSVYNLIKMGKDASSQNAMVASADSIDGDDMTAGFLRREVSGNIDKPEELPENPNVILIMTEGLSQEIIDDDRDICPNISWLEDNSIYFSNYFNHTFATYRGIIGQLYSGYQLKNYDTNTLVSIQSILMDQGYNTTFINTEPNNARFTSYLEDLNFESIVTDVTSGNVTDKDAYEKLFEVCKEQSDKESSFFTAIYTFGTHTSFDSPDEVYGSGDDKMLNKFYNMDYQFGKFLEKFNESDMAEDTIIVFTADHSTYTEEEYTKTFPESKRESAGCGEMPLCIYYKGIEPDKFDVGGRNSLALAPTILDYLDISAINYFLGISLFIPNDETNSNYDCLYFDGGSFLSSDKGKVEYLSEAREELAQKNLTAYFTAKTQKPSA